ncbi:MAG: hypothetical protein ACOC93_00215 [Planctomycetota bacterium]
MGRQHQRYSLDCPRCGRVEGVGQTGVEDLASTPEETIEERLVEDLEGHPERKVRCPRCGTWVEADRAHPRDAEARGRERYREED